MHAFEYITHRYHIRNMHAFEYHTPVPYTISCGFYSNSVELFLFEFEVAVLNRVYLKGCCCTVRHDVMYRLMWFGMM